MVYGGVLCRTMAKGVEGMFGVIRVLLSRNVAGQAGRLLAKVAADVE